jgi:hypothetical protein
MALKSKQFIGDLKLAAAAVSDPAHIVPGACGPHVAKIQYALIAVDQASIALDELRRAYYGSSTADAVTAFKQKRNIINRAYQSQVDNIVGKMTIAALDAALLAKRAAPAPPVKVGTFFVTAPVNPPQSFADVLGSCGLDSAAQIAAFRDPHNSHLHGGAGNLLPDHWLRALLSLRVVNPGFVVVPLDIQLKVNEFTPVIDLTIGLLARPVGAPGPPTNTHGVKVRIGRNLGSGSALHWIQTVKKLNNPDPNVPVEFVDGGGQNRPYYNRATAGPDPVEFDDTPSGPIAKRPGGGVDFTATTTLAVEVRPDQIILAAGKVWRYVIGTSRTLPAGVAATAPRDATDADFQNQVRILRKGLSNSRGLSTGPNLNYIVRPAPNTVVP